MTVYLIDANVLISANADFYPLDRLPQFWDWLLAQAQAGTVKMPLQVYDEVAGSPDILGKWLNRTDVNVAMILDEPTDRQRFQHVLDQGYGLKLTDVELEEMGKDPFLIAAALGNSDRVVVTRETSSPRKKRANQKIPDICNTLGIKSITDYELYRRLSFSIK